MKNKPNNLYKMEKTVLQSGWNGLLQIGRLGRANSADESLQKFQCENLPHERLQKFNFMLKNKLG